MNSCLFNFSSAIIDAFLYLQLLDCYRRRKIGFLKRANGSIWCYATLVVLYVQSYVNTFQIFANNKEMQGNMTRRMLQIYSRRTICKIM